MNKIVLTLIFFACFICVFCQSSKKEIKGPTSFTNQTFEYRNDTINQTVELLKISRDTLILNIKTSNLKRRTSCSIEGMAIRDTVGDFLNEEETVQDENGEVYSVINYRFFNKDKLNILCIQLDKIKNNRLIYYKVESEKFLEKSNCLLYSIGTLRKKALP